MTAGKPYEAQRREREKRETQLVRDLVRGLDQRDVFLLGKAAGMLRVVLAELDGSYPDPQRRTDADRLGQLADLLWRANTARDFLEEQAGGDSEAQR